MYYYDVINLRLFNLGVTAVLRNISIFCNSDNFFYFVYDDGYVGSRFHLSLLMFGI